MSTIDEDIAARLALCWKDVSGIATAFANARSFVLQPQQTPCVAVLVGPLVAPSHRTADGVQLRRQYISRLYAYAVAGGLETEDGAANYDLTTPFLERGHVYFAAHPTLATDALDSLDGVVGVTETLDTGVRQQVAPGGGFYWGIDFTHTITALVAVTQVYV